MNKRIKKKRLKQLMKQQNVEHEAGKATIERIEKGETTKEDNDMIDFLHDLFNV